MERSEKAARPAASAAVAVPLHTPLNCDDACRQASAGLASDGSPAAGGCGSDHSAARSLGISDKGHRK